MYMCRLQRGKLLHTAFEHATWEKGKEIDEGEVTEVICVKSPQAVFVFVAPDASHAAAENVLLF